MKNARVDLSAAREDLYEPLMRAVCPSSQGEAAFRLVYRVEPLWEWLLSHGFIELKSREHYDLVDIDLRSALARMREDGGSSGSEGSGPEIDGSSRAVLAVAANLAGSDHGSLRNVLPELDGEHVAFVAEAVMYAAGYLDGSADPWGNEDPRTSTGWGRTVTRGRSAWRASDSEDVK
ncbi:hypothetical protein [Kitasatospora fiedleri]|uniref:hypothetical protein n=1 Tax=Kitasatospora fiedleri TaxID=2991545 RepID=UPI00249B2D80|nr:hypothetical protein [Kitasatospora fiedleri]